MGESIRLEFQIDEVQDTHISEYDIVNIYLGDLDPLFVRFGPDDLRMAGSKPRSLIEQIEADQAQPPVSRRTISVPQSVASGHADIVAKRV